MTGESKKFSFGHYLLVCLWPPMGLFYTGRPGGGIFMSIVLAIAVPCTLGIALIGWLGMVPHMFGRMRAYERGFEVI